MSKALSLVSIVVLICVLSAHAKIHVMLNVFSGTRNPSWTLTGHLETKALKYISGIIKSEVRYEVPYYQMGYTGFTLRIEGNSMVDHTIYGFQEFESFLLKTWPEHLQFSQVVSHVRDIMNKRVLIEAVNSNPVVIKDKCDVPVLGSDNNTVYNPQTDCCGYFIYYQSENNCYDYGNDIVTNTFAQPGRGSGHRWEYDTCESVRAAAERDGLVWIGTDLPSGNPPIGHYISLHIWPNTNFHWLRKDTNLPNHWSHKPGGTAVRDVDNNGKKITDPSKADVSPWSQFCGYMATVPSKVTIN
jgi:hypothetical protein